LHAKLNFWLQIQSQERPAQREKLKLEMQRSVNRPNPSRRSADIPDTHNPDDDHAYLQDLYNSYGDVSTHATRVNLRVLLILLNKFDRWGRTTAAREAMMQRYRTEACPEIVN
jgi:hypothetical protein